MYVYVYIYIVRERDVHISLYYIYIYTYIPRGNRIPLGARGARRAWGTARRRASSEAGERPIAAATPDYSLSRLGRTPPSTNSIVPVP